MKNIILIGMPSCGKSSIGQEVAKRLHMNFIDMDAVIVKEAKMTIPEIFKQLGEVGFREKETQVAKQLSQLTNSVIATGGGVIKKPINMEYLKEGGSVFFIDRDLSLLISEDPNRPLSSSKEAVKQLYEQRIDLYRQYATHIIENNHDLYDCIDKIIQKLELI